MVKRVTLTVFNGERATLSVTMVKRTTLTVFNGEKGDT